jgi:hypothetical protein
MSFVASIDLSDVLQSGKHGVERAKIRDMAQQVPSGFVLTCGMLQRVVALLVYTRSLKELEAGPSRQLFMQSCARAV